MNPEPQPLYVILGARGSGRREVLQDLLANGLEDNLRVLFLHSPDEGLEPTPEANGVDRFGTVQVVACRYAIDASDSHSPHLPILPEVLPEADCLVFMADGFSSPADMVEGLVNWLDEHPEWEVARVITVLHCALLAENPKALPWFEACIHFSDVVLLNKREGVENKWIRDFQERHRKAALPALFAMVKKGRVDNPAAVLFPEARRLTHVFEREDDDDEDSLPELVIEEGGDLGPDPDAETTVDPFLDRHDHGERRVRLPDIQRFLL